MSSQAYKEKEHCQRLRRHIIDNHHGIATVAHSDSDSDCDCDCDCQSDHDIQFVIVNDRGLQDQHHDLVQVQTKYLVYHDDSTVTESESESRSSQSSHYKSEEHCQGQLHVIDLVYRIESEPCDRSNDGLRSRQSLSNYVVDDSKAMSLTHTHTHTESHTHNSHTVPGPGHVAVAAPWPGPGPASLPGAGSGPTARRLATATATATGPGPILVPALYPSSSSSKSWYYTIKICVMAITCIAIIVLAVRMHLNQMSGSMPLPLASSQSLESESESESESELEVVFDYEQLLKRSKVSVTTTSESTSNTATTTSTSTPTPQSQTQTQPQTQPQPQQPRRVLPVHISGSHHHVARHWFRYIRQGRLNATGNTLVHIDSHSDMMFVDTRGRGSEFSRKDWKKFMRMWMSKHVLLDAEALEYQRSVDVGSFIVPLVVRGMFDRIVWIRQDWEQPYENEWNDPSPGCYTVTFGFNGKNQFCCDLAELNERFCAKPRGGHTVQFCVIILSEAVHDAMHPDPNPDPSEYDTQHGILAAMMTAAPPGTVILDIDEDAFSSLDPCYGGAVLGGVDPRYLHRWDEITFKCKSNPQCYKMLMKNQADVFELLVDVFEDREPMKIWDWVELSDIPSESDDGYYEIAVYLKAMSNLALRDMSHDQATKMWHAWRACDADAKETAGMISAGTETHHISTQQEIDQALHQILQLFQVGVLSFEKISLVHLTRSMKDGYLPQELLPAIEWGTLSMISAAMQHEKDIHEYIQENSDGSGDGKDNANDESGSGYHHQHQQQHQQHHQQHTQQHTQQHLHKQKPANDIMMIKSFYEYDEFQVHYDNGQTEPSRQELGCTAPYPDCKGPSMLMNQRNRQARI
jgi:UPF0489 domain